MTRVTIVDLMTGFLLTRTSPISQRHKLVWLKGLWTICSLVSHPGLHTGIIRIYQPYWWRVSIFLHICIMSGDSSKKRWERMEGYEHLRFPLNSELACLVNHCMLPFLRRLLLNNNNSYFIFIAMESQFSQTLDFTDTATRWTSHRHVELGSLNSTIWETLQPSVNVNSADQSVTFLFFSFFFLDLVFFLYPLLFYRRSTHTTMNKCFFFLNFSETLLGF